MPVIDGKYYDTDDTSWWEDLIDKVSPKQPSAATRAHAARSACGDNSGDATRQANTGAGCG
jgi:hypothetical protein